MRQFEFLFALLIVAIITKTTRFVADVYVLRGLSEGLCLLAGFLWVLRQPSSASLTKYYLFFLYLTALALTLMVGSKPIYILAEVASLLAVVLFSVAITEARIEPHRLIKIALVCLTIVCGLSLISLIVSPDSSYMHRLDGSRFRGVFSSPGQFASAVGLVLGMALFTGRLNWLLRWGSISLALAGLFLSGARTSWAAAALALIVAMFFYGKRRALMAAGATCVAAAAITVVYLSGDAASQLAHIARMDTLGTLTGRTLIWEVAFEKFWNSPFLGHGYALGHEAFRTEQLFEGNGIWNEEVFTMHSGYVQALLDAGFIGAVFYFSIMLMAPVLLIIRDRARLYAVQFYALVFLSIANFGETLVFTASTFSSVLYWYLAVFAFSLRSRDEFLRPMPTITQPSALGSTQRMRQPA